MTVLSQQVIECPAISGEFPQSKPVKQHLMLSVQCQMTITRQKAIWHFVVMIHSHTLAYFSMQTALEGIYQLTIFGIFTHKMAKIVHHPHKPFEFKKLTLFEKMPALY